MTSALEGGEWSTSWPGRTLPPRKTRYPLYRRLGETQGRYGQVRKISPPTGIRSPDRPALSQSLHRLSYPAHRNYWGECKIAFWGHINGQAKDKKRFVLRNIWYIRSIIQLCSTVLALVKATKCHDSKVPSATYCRSLFHIWGKGVVKHPNIPVFQKEIYDKITSSSAYYFVFETWPLRVSTIRRLHWLRYFVACTLNNLGR
jgi:hypothetical protein